MQLAGAPFCILFRGNRQAESMRFKFERSGQMGGKVLPVVSARIEMEFVRDTARHQEIVKLLGARIEAVFVLSATIEINFSPAKRLARAKANGVLRSQ